jgi:hypothetical protein
MFMTKNIDKLLQPALTVGLLKYLHHSICSGYAFDNSTHSGSLDVRLIYTRRMILAHRDAQQKYLGTSCSSTAIIKFTATRTTLDPTYSTNPCQSVDRRADRLVW